MKILIVEDDDQKRADLQAFIEGAFEFDSIVVARSFQSGIRAIVESSPDFVFLDMTMRNFDRTLLEDGGRPHPFAGREILRQMQRNKLKMPVLVVTHFDRFGEESDYMTLSELTQQLHDRFANYVGTIHYRSNVDDWKPAILNATQGILKRRVAK